MKKKAKMEEDNQKKEGKSTEKKKKKSGTNKQYRTYIDKTSNTDKTLLTFKHK